MVKRTCKIEDCDKPVKTRGWCGMHYSRWQRRGTTDDLRVYVCGVEGCDRPYQGRNMCQLHYYRWLHGGKKGPVPVGRVLPDLRKPVPVPPYEERMKAKIDERDPGECWPWLGALTRKGYGIIISRAGRNSYAHRAVYEQFVGPIPDGLEIDHTCHSFDMSCPGGDTCPHRRCVNPSHLEPVTHAENVRRADKWKRRALHS